MKELAAFKAALGEALERAGSVLRKHAGKARVSLKGRANLLTQADLESQEAILAVLRKRFPAHDYLAEERASRLTGALYAWVVDPLDGTTNYAHGYPAYCVSIALLRRGEPLVAGVYDPSRDEAFLAESGRGARLNGRRLGVSKTAALKDSLLVTGFAYDRAERSRYYVEFYRDFMTRSHDVRRSGSAALDLSWIAAGRADGFWELGLSPWDVAAGLLLVREAGGKVTDFSGKPWGPLESFGRQTLATNGLLHDPMRKVIRRHL
jgi:myo-inositol-1(or 4)-monophosphatase